MTLQALLNKHNIIHFSEHEIQRVSSDIPEDLIINLIPTLLIADKMREQLGFKMTFNSVYRDKEDNDRVGGSDTSLHMRCNAIDIRPLSRDKEELELMQQWVLHTKLGIQWNGTDLSQRDMGIGLYNTFLHIDTRALLDYPAPARWDKRHA